MTLDEFIAEYRAAKQNYLPSQIIGKNYIRFEDKDGHTYCPLTLVWHYESGEKLYSGQFPYVARKLGINPRTAEYIAHAADNNFLHIPTIAEIRSSLLSE